MQDALRSIPGQAGRVGGHRAQAGSGPRHRGRCLATSTWYSTGQPVPRVAPNPGPTEAGNTVGPHSACLPPSSVRGGSGSRAFGDCLDAFEGAEHVTLVATFPQEPAERAPHLGEDIVAEVE